MSVLSRSFSQNGINQTDTIKTKEMLLTFCRQRKVLSFFNTCVLSARRNSKYVIIFPDLFARESIFKLLIYSKNRRVTRRVHTSVDK